MNGFLEEDVKSLVHLNADGKRELCLKGRKLSQVPDALTKLTDLEVLDLSDNELAKLPEGLKNLKQLATLVLSGNKLEELPRIVCQLKTLTTLDVAYNTISKLPESISNLDKLTTLNLSYNELEEIPRNLCQLKKLTTLDITSNPIKRTANEITNLRLLTTLRMAGTTLRELPSFLCQLKRLVNLDVSRNEISRLPETLSGLSQLQTLNLSTNKLEELPKSLFVLKRLTTLDISWNSLKKIPKNIEQLHQLITLRLEGNNLFEVPEALGQLENLTTLDVSHNRLVTLPRAIACLTHLKLLLMSCNKLHVLPSGIFPLKSLQTLDAGYNEIQRLSDRIANLTELTSLQLAGNELTEIPESVLKLTKLTTLNVSDNFLTTIPESIADLCKLDSLNLARNHLQNLPMGIFHLKSLTTLILSSNQLNSINDDIINLDHLTALDVSDNRLEDLPAAIFKLTTLSTLILSSNQLKEIPEDIINLAHLTTLELSENRLTELPEALFQLKTMTTLTLSSNQLQRMSGDISNLQHLTTLDVSGNRLKELPENICQLKWLTTLCVSGNLLKKLPLGLETLRNLTSLQVEENPQLTFPPVDVWQDGLSSIMTYLHGIRKGKAFHQKVVLLGSSGAGKTSLANTLAQNKPSCVKEEDRTIVLDRIPWEIDMNETLLDVSMIDFGGDEIYKIVHPLFLDESSLVLLVVNLARYSEETFTRDIGTWINVLKTRVPEARVILVGTHVDCLENKEELFLKVEMVKEHFKDGHLKSEDFVIVSSKDFQGIRDLRSCILDFVVKNGKVIPSDWMHIYNDLQNSEVVKNRPFLTFDVVKQLVDSRNKGVVEIFIRLLKSKDESTKTMLSFFHNAGILLWYQHSDELKKFVFHRAEFLTEVMKVVFSDKIATGSVTFGGNFRHFLTSDSFEEAKQDLLRRGILSRSLLKGLWRDHRIEEDVFDAMIDLFTHLDLCYPMEKEGHRDGLRFPWFLTDDVPEVGYVKKLMHEAPCLGSHRLSLKYVYPDMFPTPLYHNFVVRLHRHVHDLKSRHDWKDGVYAQVKQSQVLVHKSFKGAEASITVAVEGLDLLELWKILLACHEELTHLMAQWPGLRWECSIVCPHCTRMSVQEPGKFPVSNLDRHKCPKGPVTCYLHVEKVPACLVYPLRRDDPKHQQTLREFTCQESQDVASSSTSPAAQQNLVFKSGSPSAEELNLLALEVGPKWKVLGRQLRIAESDLNQVEADHEGQYEQCYRMLKRWTEVQDHVPTYEDLAKALQNDAVGEPELAGEYCCPNGGEKYVEIPSPTPNVVFREGRPNPEEVLSLSNEMKNWKQLGRALKMKDSQLDEIDADIRGLFDKSYEMLRRWMESQGSAATYVELAKGLEIVGRRDLIRKFCRESKK